LFTLFGSRDVLFLQTTRPDKENNRPKGTIVDPDEERYFLASLAFLDNDLFIYLASSLQRLLSSIQLLYYSLTATLALILTLNDPHDV